MYLVAIDVTGNIYPHKAYTLEEFEKAYAADEFGPLFNLAHTFGTKEEADAYIAAEVEAQHEVALEMQRLDDFV